MLFRPTLYAVLSTLLLCLPAQAGYVTLVNSGPSANRVDMVFLGDGYTAADLSAGLYTTHINSYLAHMFAPDEPPFARYQNFFNVHRIDLVSNERGADIPPDGIYRDTALDARYYGDGSTERLLTISESKANSAITTNLAGAGFTAEMRLVTVNSTKYGGSGGSFAVFAGGSSSANEIALHELGHSFASLADEYGGNSGAYPGGEPSAVNITKDSTGAKWSRWLGYNDPDTGLVGAYEGGYYYDHGIYRPSANSKMRSLGVPFDPIAREQWIIKIYAKVDPLDAWLSNASPLTNPAALWVDTIDPAVIDVTWTLDGAPLAFTGETLSLSPLNLANGTYTLTALAKDNTPWVRLATSALQQSVSWSVVIVPEPAGLVVLVLGGVIALRRRRWHRP